jgi:dTDP-4-dehydrorhamnose 3,5-epimerase-like enzyme
VFVHEDDRRKLIEFGDGNFLPFVVCKAIVAKDECVLGNHWHAKKDESFLLLSGTARRVVIGEWHQFDQEAPQYWHVPRGTFHVFELEPGSVLIGTATAPFDQEDEIPLDKHPDPPVVFSRTTRPAT